MLTSLEGSRRGKVRMARKPQRQATDFRVARSDTLLFLSRKTASMSYPTCRSSCLAQMLASTCHAQSISILDSRDERTRIVNLASESEPLQYAAFTFRPRSRSQKVFVAKITIGIRPRRLSWTRRLKMKASLAESVGSLSRQSYPIEHWLARGKCLTAQSTEPPIWHNLLYPDSNSGETGHVKLC